MLMSLIRRIECSQRVCLDLYEEQLCAAQVFSSCRSALNRHSPRLADIQRVGEGLFGYRSCATQGILPFQPILMSLILRIERSQYVCFDFYEEQLCAAQKLGSCQSAFNCRSPRLGDRKGDFGGLGGYGSCATLGIHPFQPTSKYLSLKLEEIRGECLDLYEE